VQSTYTHRKRKKKKEKEGMRPGNCRHTEDVSSSACPQFQVPIEGLGSSDSKIVSGGQWMAKGREEGKRRLGNSLCSIGVLLL